MSRFDSGRLFQRTAHGFADFAAGFESPDKSPATGRVVWPVMKVSTQQLGDWPGGVGVITQIEPDANAAEITVKSDDPMVEHYIRNGILSDNEIGVFDYEEVELIF